MKTAFSGFVLAGGKSSRMGTCKAFLEFGGETFLERAAHTLELAVENRVKIVVNENQYTEFYRRFPAFDYVFDVFAERGALGGIHAALKNCDTEFAVVLAVDLPFVTREAIDLLAVIARSENRVAAAVVPAQTDGRAQPLCAVYRVRECLPPLENLLAAKSSAAARDFLRLVSCRTVAQKDLSDDERIFFNVNRPADFRSIE